MFLGTLDNATSVSITDVKSQYNNVAYILIAGQSNIANHGAAITPYNYTASSPVYNYYNGHIKVAQSPVLGEWNFADTTKGHLASGNLSTFLPELGDLIVQNTTYDAVVFVNLAIGGSAMANWVPNSGPISRIDAIDNYSYDTGWFERMELAVSFKNALGADYTHILWCQGESDNCNNVTTASYESMFGTFKTAVRDLGFNAPIYMSQTAWIDPTFDVGGGTFCTNSEPIIKAQNNLIQDNADILYGPNTDVLDKATYRYDYAHFNAAGLQRLAQDWYRSLTTVNYVVDPNFNDIVPQTVNSSDVIISNDNADTQDCWIIKNSIGSVSSVITSDPLGITINSTYTASLGYVYVRQLLSNVLDYSGKSLIMEVDITNNTAGLNYDVYVTARFTEDDNTRVLCIDSTDASLPTGRNTITVPFTVPDISGTPINAENGLSSAFRIIGQSTTGSSTIHSIRILEEN